MLIHKVSTYYVLVLASVFDCVVLSLIDGVCVTSPDVLL